MLIEATEKKLIQTSQLTGPAIELAPISDELRAISIINDLAEERWADRLVVEPALSRSVVSFQANKARAVYRWYKYKEAFSAGLVEYFLERYNISSGTLFDPFAGSGTALFTAGSFGLRAEGIELLPIGQKIIETKQVIDWDFTLLDEERLEFWSRKKPWKTATNQNAIPELRITKGAYSEKTMAGMGKYLAAASLENQRVQQVLMFALLCILESISFTRKDGQYLRWDYRSGRRQPSKIFDKGKILEFDEAISDKLNQIIIDLGSDSTPGDLFAVARTKTEIQLHTGSCLNILPSLSSNYVDCVITSPPYCNRYDYTRTYALELALLGSGEEDVLKLRQEMLSCTVENRAKDLLSMNPLWQHAISCVDNHDLLQLILRYLEAQNELDLLNNTGIPRMVRGYFYEMTCVIAELSRICKPGARVIMVNDNVRYAGASISVDIILSELAEQLGFVAEQILVSPSGKGNSSQQMGLHGREKLRKCVYVWRKL
jgi:DNA modification methylase